MVEKSTGGRLPVVTNPVADKISIYIGLGPHLETIGLDKLEFAYVDGFEVAFPDAQSIVIAGNSEWGVTEFMERYIGVRWLMPGPFGTDLPEHKTLSIPAETVRQAPSFESRQLQYATGPQTSAPQ